MLIPGSLSGTDWGQPASMARSIENEMIAAGILALDDETPDATEQRRKTFIALATGIIGHLKSNHELQIAAGALGAQGNPGDNAPAAARTLTNTLR
jgi:hypothetical protein